MWGQEDVGENLSLDLLDRTSSLGPAGVSQGISKHQLPKWSDFMHFNYQLLFFPLNTS